MAEFKPELKEELKAELKLEHVIAERYQVVALLGAGGMGAVYLVEEVSSKKKFALKTILASGASDRNLKRFEIETNATKLLNHPNLVQIHDFGFVSENQPYFVMDYCDGQDLAALIKSKGTLSVEEALDVFITVCNALAYAHSQGVVHRDLKPSNVMITDGVVKVLDFGIAKVFRDETAFNTVTRTGEVFGSPYYMSPEQCHGKAIDLRSDVYSLGCMFFEALTGSPPFVGDTALSTMLRHQSANIPTLKEATLGKNFPSDLETIVLRMLAKNPADRYQDLLHAADDLKHVQRGEPIPVIAPDKEAKPLNKGLLAILAGAFVIVLITAWLLRPQAEPDYRSAFKDRHSENPLISSVEKDIEARSLVVENKYFSKSANGKVRDFHFPAIAFGDFGHGDDPGKYQVARGMHKNVQIPIGLNVRTDTSVIPLFRNDEVGTLILKGYLVTDKTVGLIKDWHEISYLNMDDTDITNAAIANLKGMKKLKGLSLNDTKITGDALLSLPLEQLVWLEINHLKKVQLILPRLRANTSMVHLSLIGDEIADEDLRTISEFKSLKSLSLLGCHITDKGIEYLTRLPSLQFLYIDGKGVTPNILTGLKKLKLEKMKIENCPWSYAEALDFRHKMKRGNRGLKLDILLELDKTKRDSILD